jgi:hypothetical protein
VLRESSDADVTHAAGSYSDLLFTPVERSKDAQRASSSENTSDVLGGRPLHPDRFPAKNWKNVKIPTKNEASGRFSRQCKADFKGSRRHSSRLEGYSYGHPDG